MLLDLDVAPDWQPPDGDSQAEVAIAGGGLAGLLLASKLAAAGRRVILFEASDFAQRARSQPFYRAQQVGQPTLASDTTRLRFLGGATNHWGGWCRPLEAEDMSTRPGAELPGWPFGPEILAPYLAEASALLGFDPPPPPGAPVEGSEGLLAPIAFGFSQPLRAGEALLPALAASGNALVVLNANAVGAEAGPAGLTHLLVRGYGGAATKRVPARLFVLALGAMESVRLLLALNRRFADRLGNAAGLVGLGYMQHLHGRVGHLVRLFPGPDPAALARAADGHPQFLATTAAFLAAAGGRARFYAEVADCAEGDDWHWLTRLACGTGGVQHLRATAEQWPSRTSRLLLGAGEDALGLPPLVIDWQPLAGDKARLRQAALACGAWLARASGWRLRLADWLLAEDATLPLPSQADGGDRGAAGHQMGGARMGSTADQGVSDIDSLVYGSDNLYLASTALFAGGGHAPPTLTLVQLTLRLAQRLERRLETL